MGALGLLLVAYYDPPVIQIWIGIALGAVAYLVRRKIVGRSRFARLSKARNRRARVALIVLVLTGLWVVDLKLLLPETSASVFWLVPVCIGFFVTSFLDASEGFVLHTRRYRNDPLR